mmetsp:Transcript_1938/g.2713  ORF Transcript_1938/g.2713 Transcript_1938/m.2713 type:complete len:102 (+) Transcript_1938:3926-4231(+)
MYYMSAAMTVRAGITVRQSNIRDVQREKLLVYLQTREFQAVAMFFTTVRRIELVPLMHPLLVSTAPVHITQAFVRRGRRLSRRNRVQMADGNPLYLNAVHL